MESTKHLRLFVFLLVALSLGSGALASSPCGVHIPDNAIYRPDNFPGMYGANYTKTEGAIVTEGAPNFRKVPENSVYGMGQATISGLRKVMTYLKGKKNPEIISVNLRQETFLYINGKAYSLRDPKNPFENLDNPGATEKEMQAMEVCLKNRLQEEAKNNGGKVHITQEDDQGKTRDMLVPLESVMTLTEVYESLRQEGFRIVDHRVPMADEKAPTPQNVDDLLAIDKDFSKGKNSSAVLLFNCQAGHGRTTTALATYEISQGMDAKESINLVGALFNLHNEIATAKPALKASYQAREEILQKIAEYEKFARSPAYHGQTFSQRLVEEARQKSLH